MRIGDRYRFMLGALRRIGELDVCVTYREFDE